MALQPGTKIDRFTVQLVLGEGGMGTVYAVTDPARSGLPLALKVLRDDLAASETALQRFRREAEAMQHLRQRGLVWLQEYRLEPPTPWLLMERVPGVPAPGGKRAVTLDDLLKAWGGNLPETVVASILDICLQGLAAIHNQRLIHRDIKPGNVLLDTSVDSRDNPDRALQYLEPKLGDLGLSGLARSDGLADRSLGVERTVQPELTMRQGRPDAHQAALLGTYDYMSPEQKRGEKATPASDVYSLTLVAFRLLTGQAMGMKGVRELRPELVAEWDEFLARGYAPRPEDRYPTATEMRAGLLPVEAALAVVRPAPQAKAKPAEATPSVPVPRFRGVLKWAAVFVLAASVVAGLAGYGWYRRETAHRIEAERQQEEARQKQEVEQKAAAQAEAERLAADAEQKRRASQVGQPLSVDLGGGTSMEFVWVEPLKGWVGKYEVTNGEYRKFKAEHSSGKYSGQSLNGERQPVVNVSYGEAVAFCEWLNGKAKVLAGYRVRLPRDLEWSVAVGLSEARQGTLMEKDGKIADVYPWGSQWPPPRGAGNFADATMKRAFPSMGAIEGYDDGYAVTAPVGSFTANKYGLYDMSGNMWEWCSDLYNQRVLRGGSWLSNDPGSRLSSSRYNRGPDGRGDLGGFRCVVVSSP